MAGSGSDDALECGCAANEMDPPFATGPQSREKTTAVVSPVVRQLSLRYLIQIE
jgi:hypothetical protein